MRALFCLLVTWSVAIFLLFGATCQTPTPPPPTPAPPPAPTLLTGDQVTGELVEAGCLAPGSSDAVVAELMNADAHDQSLRQSIVCLFEGGTIAGCNAPCTRAGFVRRPDQ